MSFAKNEVVVFPATQLSCSSGPFSCARHRGALWPGAVYLRQGPPFSNLHKGVYKPGVVLLCVLRVWGEE